MTSNAPDDLEDEEPCTVTGFHDFEPYDDLDGSVKNGCRECGEPGDPEILVPAPGTGGTCVPGWHDFRQGVCNHCGATRETA